MKRLFSSIVFFLSLAVSAADDDNPAADQENTDQPAAVEKTEQKNGTDEMLGKATPFRKDVLFKVNEAISEIEKNCPSAINKFSAQDQEKIIKSLISSMNSGMEYLPANTAVPEDVKKRAKPLPSIIISAQKILYLRLDEFNAETYAKLKDDCTNTSKLANKPVGLIIDLRDCQGFDYESCLKSVALFCAPEKLPKTENLELPIRILNIPVMVLVGNKTKGDGEIFTRLMLENGQCLVSGGGTAGSPFKKVKVVLKSGNILLIPAVPECLSSIPTSQLIPALNVVPYPQVEYEKLSATAGSEDTDKCLLRAIDLLISLEALHREQKKRSNETPKKSK
ncbi:MAG TPA: hypothetical protein DCZ94_16735 [Lentisphaeria bacterium]|nr:MAG: hypothetical protein A2X48_16795 [Lentisphaerae bacterium GWF2_49_21]HBC88595.1 hypothetical protein [Lentisphaeria bacterium]